MDKTQVAGGLRCPRVGLWWAGWGAWSKVERANQMLRRRWQREKGIRTSGFTIRMSLSWWLKNKLKVLPYKKASLPHATSQILSFYFFLGSNPFIIIHFGFNIWDTLDHFQRLEFLIFCGLITFNCMRMTIYNCVGYINRLKRKKSGEQKFFFKKRTFCGLLKLQCKVGLHQPEQLFYPRFHLSKYYSIPKGRKMNALVATLLKIKALFQCVGTLEAMAKLEGDLLYRC